MERHLKRIKKSILDSGLNLKENTKLSVGGEFSPTDLTIIYNPDFPLAKQIPILLHELGHYLADREYQQNKIKEPSSKLSHRGEAFTIADEIMAWQEAVILAHQLNIPKKYISEYALGALGTYAVSFLNTHYKRKRNERS